MKFWDRIPAKQRKWVWIALGLLIVLMAVLLWPRNAQRVLTGENLLKDGDFAEYAVKGSGAWYEDAYVSRATYTQYDFVTEDDGSVSAHITNMLANDARFAQIVNVRPDSLYCLEGDVRASAQGGLGANLSVEGPYVFSDSLYDQPEWTHLRLYGRTSPDQHSVTVFVRLGGYSGEATGEAWFRNISLTEVAEVPDGYYAKDWFTRKSQEYNGSANEDSYTEPSAVGHAALMLFALLVYGGMAWYALRRTDRKKPLEAGELLVLALFALGLFVRVLLAVLVHGYDVDVGDFSAWATEVAVNGPASFYRLDLDPEIRRSMYICDYPPGYILVLGVVGLLGQWFATGTTEFMIKIPPILADLGMAFVIYRALAARDEKGRGKGRTVTTAFTLAVTVLFLFNPLLLLTGAGWGQSDSVMMFFLTLTLVFGMRKNWTFALPCYVLAVLMKPQALMFGPLGLVALFLQYREVRKSPEERSAMLKDFLIGFAAMLAVAAAVVLPFCWGRGFGWLFELYGKTMSYYAYATVNACNLYFLVGANWAGLAASAPRWFGWTAFLLLGVPAGWSWYKQRGNLKKAIIPLAALACVAALTIVGTFVELSWEFWSTALMALVIALALALCVQAGSLRHLPLYGGLLMTGLFAMGGMMHERYLFPAIPLLLWAWRIEDDDRILLAALLATAGCFLNVGCVLSRNQRIGGSSGHLSIPQIGHVSDMGLLEYLSAFVNVCAFSLTCWLGFEAADESYAPWRIPAAAPSVIDAGTESKPAAKGVSLGDCVAEEELNAPNKARKLDRTDLCLILVITAAYAALAFFHLGSTTSPQNGYEFHAQYEPNPAYTLPAEQTQPEPVVQDEPDASGDLSIRSQAESSLFAVAEAEEEIDPAYWNEAEDWPYEGWNEETDWEGYDGDDGWTDEYEAYEASADDEYVLITESVTFDLGREYDDFRMLYMGGVHQYDCSFTVETSADGVSWGNAYNCQMDIGNLFQWFYVRSYRGTSRFSLDGRYVRLTAQDAGLTLMEVLFRDAEGNVLPVSSAVSSTGNDVSALIDEQDTLRGEPGWFNSMYFDEIYHARTGYEHFIGMTPYETTHPPLGKVFISWCIGIFGMTPFGWRFAGTLAGVLMLPGLYLLARLLFRKRRYAILCCLMLTLDTLHYTQTRLATIDSFVVLFIIWSYYFMFRWMFVDFFGQPLRRTIVPLALSGLMMGLAVASKWTGCYAGVGLAILFFISVGRRWYVIQRAKEQTDGGERADAAREQGLKRLLITVASCFIWFVAVPAAIYYASYIPYFAPNGGVTLKRIIQAAEGMFNYHSSPGLGMDHPYYSPWYEWPFAVVKPMYYAADSYETAGYASSILAFGNIAVWWVGFACMLATLAACLWKQFGGLRRGYLPDAPAEPLAPAGQYDRRPLMLVIAFAAQYLPWILVPRGTYIYHYFPAVPFIILSTGLIFEYIEGWLMRRAAHKALAYGRTAEAAADAGRRADRKWLIVLTVYLLIVFALFAAFFPYASGLTVRKEWLDAMNWFGNLYY